MTGDERMEQRAAFAVKCIGDPCTCPLCVAAGISHRGIAYVPIDDDDLGVMRAGHREVRGHWIHGEPLARWWKARDHFFTLHPKEAKKLFPKPKPKPITTDVDDPLGVFDDQIPVA